jgi:glycosyltransferase involved in cell wall biosynthesis
MPGAPLLVDDRRAVLIPSFNSGALLESTVRATLAAWRPVVVVLDGSTDGSGDSVIQLARREPGLHVIEQTGNEGKGAAVYAGWNYLADLCYTHAAVLDADGQHETSDIGRFMQASRTHPKALIMGAPLFAKDAPRVRVLGHRIADFWARLETRGARLGSSLFGFRVYPILPSLKIMERTRRGRGFDFDTMIAVRLAQEGTPIVNLPTPVRYRTNAQGGISHFRYLRDNILLVRTHANLLARAILREVAALSARG